MHVNHDTYLLLNYEDSILDHQNNNIKEHL